jgi:cell division protein FtsN
VPPRPAAGGYTVSFATLLDANRARGEATRIRVDGQMARVVSSVIGGRTLYRVVLGPYPTRAEAERVGQRAGYPYWVFSGEP